jgi:hypothetical protein
LVGQYKDYKYQPMMPTVNDVPGSCFEILGYEGQACIFVLTATHPNPNFSLLC